MPVENFLEYGPMTLPKKNRWVVLGSGPSFDKFHTPQDDVGVIVSNMVVLDVPCADVVIMSHYESVIKAADHFKYVGLVFIPDPISVGYYCKPGNLLSMVGPEFMDEFVGDKLRLYKKVESLQESKLSDYSLVSKYGTCSAALHLLAKNGVKEVKTYGVDGGTQHGHNLSNSTYRRQCHPGNYDNSLSEFRGLAQQLGVEIC